jgi:MFS family permease
MVRSPHIKKDYRYFLGTGLIFFSMNVLLGSWLTRLPDLQVRLQLTEGQLGIALLGLPLGALAGNAWSRYWLSRFRVGQVAFIGIHLVMAGVLLLSGAFSMYSILFCLFLVGIADGTTNVAMNTTADTLERRYQMQIMSSCHGMFSLGGFVGAICGGLASAIGLPLPWQMLILAIGLLFFLHRYRRFVWRVATIKSSTDSEQPKRLGWQRMQILLWPALIGFCIMIGEGAISDWSPLFMRQERESGPLLAAMAYGGFSFFMALGRFSGDRIRQRLTSTQLLNGGTLLGLSGLVIALGLPWAWTGLLGFSLTGLGFSIVVPVLFSLAARLVPHRPDQGIAFIANTAVVGFLMAPPSIGFLAEHFGLDIALSLLIGLTLIAWIGTKILARRVKAGRATP